MRGIFLIFIYSLIFIYFYLLLCFSFSQIPSVFFLVVSGLPFHPFSFSLLCPVSFSSENTSHVIRKTEKSPPPWQDPSPISLFATSTYSNKSNLLSHSDSEERGPPLTLSPLQAPLLSLPANFSFSGT